MCVAAAIGYVMMISAGRVMSGVADRINPKFMAIGALIVVVSLVVLMTGVGGFAVLTAAALIGIVPQQADLSRIPLTGCLLLPVILNSLV